VRLGDELVAAGGTHALATRYGMAAIGNILTLPAYRGRGYATAVTAAVVAELLTSECRTVILNVAQHNHLAVRLYARLGFRTHCRYQEGIVQRRRVIAP
jgi:predicted GNAT family acetyltransferase